MPVGWSIVTFNLTLYAVQWHIMPLKAMELSMGWWPSGHQEVSRCNTRDESHWMYNIYTTLSHSGYEIQSYHQNSKTGELKNTALYLQHVNIHVWSINPFQALPLLHFHLLKWMHFYMNRKHKIAWMTKTIKHRLFFSFFAVGGYKQTFGDCSFPYICRGSHCKPPGTLYVNNRFPFNIAPTNNLIKCFP